MVVRAISGMLQQEYLREWNGRHLARNNKHDESFTMKDSINWLHFELLL